VQRYTVDKDIWPRSRSIACMIELLSDTIHLVLDVLDGLVQVSLMVICQDSPLGYATEHGACHTSTTKAVDSSNVRQHIPKSYDYAAEQMAHPERRGKWSRSWP